MALSRCEADVATATAAESNWGFIVQAVEEYEAMRAGEVRACEAAIPTEGGRVELCGSPGDAAHWTICYVRHEDDAVLPLVVGEQSACFERFQAIDRSGLPYWNPRFYAPPVAILDGVRLPFRPARGRFVVGVAEAPGRAVLLVAVGESLAVVQLAGKATTVVYSGRPLTFSEVDVDRTLGWRRSPDPRPRSTPRVRPSARVRAQHLRIAGAVEVDVGEGPSIEVVLSRALNALEWRARTVRLAGRRRKRRGKTKLRPVLEAMRQVILAGGGIFEGGPGDLLGEIRARCPDLDVDVETFSNVLGLIHATGTCLVQRPTPRSWRLCLSSDLRDPRSGLHRRFCEETVGLVREMVLGDGLTAANERAANERPRAAGGRGKRVPRARAVASSAVASETGTLASGAAASEPQVSSGASVTSSNSNPQSAPASPATTGPVFAEPPPTTAHEQTREPTGPGESKSDRAGEINFDAVCSNPVCGRESLCSLVMKIGAQIEAEPDPLERARYELMFATAMFKWFIGEGPLGLRVPPSVVAEWATRLVASERTNSPAAAGVRAGCESEAPGAPRCAEGRARGGTEEPAQACAATAWRAEVEARVEVGGITTAEQGAPRANGETGATDKPVDDELLGVPGAVERDDPLEAADATPDRGEANVDERPAEEFVAPERLEAGEGDFGKVSVAVGDLPAAAFEPTTTAPAATPRLELAIHHAPASAEPVAEDETASPDRAASFHVLRVEPGATNEARNDAPQATVHSTLVDKSHPVARCDVRSGGAPRRRPLFVPENCVVMHTQGWASPFVSALPVSLAWFTVPAPHLEPQSITDSTCMVSITTAASESAQIPRGPPQT